MKRKMFWGVARPSQDKNGMDTFIPCRSIEDAMEEAEQLKGKVVRGAVYR